MSFHPDVSSGGPGRPLPCLLLHVRSEYFQQIRDGVKVEEYRLRNAYWCKRLLRVTDGQPKAFGSVVIYNAYKTGATNRLELPWRGWRTMQLTHPHFGAHEVTVFAIRLADDGGAA